ncbi:MAG: long-chain fatty acid--CoA ligase [Verrucomicrobiota bacterium]|jgi:long-chain acyl-CoA synthetase
MNLACVLSDSARRDLQKTALLWGEAKFSYGELWSRSLWVAGQLNREFGVKAGDRVGIWLKNCPEYIPALFGILEAGAVVVPINNFLKPSEVQYILSDAGIATLITDASAQDRLAALRASLPNLKALPAEQIFAAPVRESSLPVTPDDGLGTGEGGSATRNAPSSELALIIYTSGTTGHPKGAMLTHANLLANLESCRVALESVQEDRFAVLLPMFHSFMLTVGILLPLYVGGSIVLIKSLHPAKSILQEIIRHHANLLPAVPQFFRALANAAVPNDLPLRICISGAAPLPGEVLKQFTARFPFPLLEGYGLSEASPVVSFNPIRGPWKAGSIGLPIPGVEVSTQNEAGEILGPEETGEICVRGANVMSGYWKQPEETAKVFRQGWLLTGDIGHRDGEGYYYITDRKKDMLLVNGCNVYPREIEEILYQYPGVREAAVVGVPDSRKGEQPLAFVSANELTTLNPPAMLQFLREQLADYKLPRQIIVLADLPRNATGKILKTRLREMLAGGELPGGAPLAAE